MVEIKDERDYVIRKAKVLEKFTIEFYENHRYNDLYYKVVEALTRDADPYEIIEKLIDINAEQFEQIKKLAILARPEKILKNE